MKAWGLAAVASSAAVFAGSALAQQMCDAPMAERSSPTSRFQDNADGTVTDKESKLMWARCAVGQSWVEGGCSGEAVRQSLTAALATAGAVNQRGDLFYSDWRVPQLPELATLIERHCTNPRVNDEVFPDTPADWFWSASPRSGTPAMSYAISFGAAGVAFHAPEEMHRVRLVRRASP